jgi:hypothetical protein
LKRGTLLEERTLGLGRGWALISKYLMVFLWREALCLYPELLLEVG